MTKAEIKKRRFSFLLIGQDAETPWGQALRRVLSSLGKQRVVTEDEAVDAVAGHYYDLVIVDAGVVWNPASLVAQLRARRTDLRILVFTSSPTWQRAREALQAGAANYVRKSLDEKQIHYVIEEALRLLPSNSED